MREGDFNCTICLEVCHNAVESSCCWNLYCETCIDGLADCPSCRHTPLRTTIAGSVRRLIGRLEVACNMCGETVQRHNLKDHCEICSMRDYQCKAKGCDFVGKKEQFLQHINDNHERDLLKLTAGSSHRNVFSPLISEASTQTVPQCSEISTQTVDDIQHKVYCGARLRKICPCVSFYTARPTWGCQKGVCGPEDGHNCAACMLLDLRERNLPERGQIVGTSGRIVILGVSGCVVESRLCFSGMGRCLVCRFVQAATSDKNSVYHRFLP